MQPLFKLLIFLAVPSAAFLTFLLQPIVGKQLMPRYGGSAGTWMTISLFFQTALLAGYGLASWLGAQSRKRALLVVGALAVLAPLTAKLPPWDFSGWHEWPAIVIGLSLSLLPALLLTTSIGIVAQGWIRARAGAVPYYLYGISNLGSLAALVSYPFVLEPWVGLSDQSTLVRGLLVLLAAVVLGLVALEFKDLRQKPGTGSDPAVSPADAPELVDSGHVLTWIVLTFSTCTLMLGAVRILSAEIGSNPLSWLVPLGLYLLSFTLTFAGWWRPWMNIIALVVLGCGLFGYMVTKGVSDETLTRWPQIWLITVVAAGSIAGHGLVYRLRPERRFFYFYLAVGVGGMFGGLFASVGAPNIFDRNLEFTAAAFLLFIIIALFQLGREGLWERLALTVLLTLPSSWYAYSHLAKERSLYGSDITYLRNHYGMIVLREHSTVITASNETTLHGAQLLRDEMRDQPTTYYTRGSAVGIVISSLQESKPSINIGAVGLGVGTLAAYPRASDSIVFWEINPLSEKVANSPFSFLKDSKGRKEVRLIDGRRGVKTAPETFDVLVIDAFSGDSIPIHLLTVEAVKEYVAKLQKDGVLLVHISNRYTDLFPVVAASAKAAGWDCFQWTASPHEAVKDGEHAAKTVYVVVHAPERKPQVDEWFDDAMKGAAYDYEMAAPGRNLIEWTDDKHAIHQVMRYKW